MLLEKLKDRDLGLMIVSCGIVLVGVIALFFDRTLGGITLFVGLGMLLMGYLSKKPQLPIKKTDENIT